MRESGRFRILEKPAAFPMREVVNNTPDGPVFDIGVDLEDYDGVVYIKVEHVQEMAEMLGMASIEEVNEYKKTIEKLTKQNEKLPDKIGEFQDELSGLVNRFHLTIGLDDDAAASAIRVEESKAIVEQLKRTHKDAPKLNGQESGFALFKGLDDIPASPSDESKPNKSGTKG